MGASKKACADCTCGRAEAEAAGIKAQLTAEMLDNPQSACGSVSYPSSAKSHPLCLRNRVILRPFAFVKLTLNPLSRVCGPKVLV